MPPEAAVIEAAPLQNPVLQATFTPPNPEPTAPPENRNAEQDRGGELERLFNRNSEPEEKPVADAVPPEKKEPPKPVEKPAPIPPKEAAGEQLKDVQLPKVDAAKKEAAKPDDSKLPEDIFEGIPETQPGNHRESARAFGTMRKRLGQLEAKFKEVEGELKTTKETAVAPPDYEAIKERNSRLESELQEREERLKEKDDRLYASDLRQRPEYKQFVDQPKADMKEFGSKLLGKYGLKYRDFTDAMELPPEERDAVLAEHMETMNRLDDGHYRAMIDSWHQIERNKVVLEAKSKEKLDEFKARDTERENKKKDGDVRAMLSAQAAHREKRSSALPFVFKPEGDDEQTKAYRDGLNTIRERATAVVRAGGLAALKPEHQAMMVEDAMTADYVLRGMGNAMEAKDRRIKELEGEKVEREKAFELLESELAEYRGGVPGGEHGVAAGTSGEAGDESLEARLNRFPRLFNR